MIRIVKLSIKNEYVDSFKDFFESRKIAIRNFEGCTHLELWQDHTNPTVFYTYSHWDDQMNLDEYRISELFKSTWSVVKPWFDHKAEAFSAHKLLQV